MNTILQLKKLRHRVKRIAQGNTIGKWQDWAPAECASSRESVLLTTSYAACQGAYQNGVYIIPGGACIMPLFFPIAV